MRPQLDVQVESRTGMPFTKVPPAQMWDLVEYLSYQRVAVSYQYDTTYFVVRFLRSTKEAAQELLNHWSEAVVPGEPVGAR